ncbi:HAD hydrolase-like protein [Enterococcus eurekensis]|uniref:HAD hydrolase-like protein n=1 Tax=Enterococcus eurekensis TaxID=1159753 RepID=A0ABV9M5N7_9ENTE
MKKTQILFDLDGTIIDPSEGIFKSILYSLDKMQWEHPSNDSLKSFIGPPLVDSYVELGMTKEEANKAVGYYRELYSQEGLYLMQPYTGIQKVLIELAKTKEIYLATSKPDVFAKQILDYLNFSQYFKGIYGANLEGTRSKKADVIRYAFDESKIESLEEVVMIGDRMHDILGASQNNIESIGVLYGFGDEKELKKAGATRIIADTLDLLKIIQ